MNIIGNIKRKLVIRQWRGTISDLEKIIEKCDRYLSDPMYDIDPLRKQLIHTKGQVTQLIRRCHQIIEAVSEHDTERARMLLSCIVNLQNSIRPISL